MDEVGRTLGDDVNGGSVNSGIYYCHLSYREQYSIVARDGKDVVLGSRNGTSQISVGPEQMSQWVRIPGSSEDRLDDGRRECDDFFDILGEELGELAGGQKE